MQGPTHRLFPHAKTMNDPLPPQTYSPGWPERLTDSHGQLYVRPRDGEGTTEFTGESCLYGLVEANGMINRSYQYVPAMGYTAAAPASDVVMSGGPWISAEDLVRYGQTPIVIPPEPIEP